MTNILDRSKSQPESKSQPQSQSQSQAQSESQSADILITANRLDDGSVVWLADDLQWRQERHHAGHFDKVARRLALAKASNSEAANEVTAIYEIPIDGKADVSARERIRALGGPSIVPPKDLNPT